MILKKYKLSQVTLILAKTIICYRLRMKKIVNFLKIFLSGNHKLGINAEEVMTSNIDRSVIKLNDDKINRLTERKRNLVLKTDLLFEETKKSAKNIEYLIAGFWPDKQKIYDIGEAIDNTSKSDIQNLADAYDELEDLDNGIREVQILLKEDFNDSRLNSGSDEVRDNMTSLAKNLTQKTNNVMEQLEKFKLPDNN